MASILAYSKQIFCHLSVSQAKQTTGLGAAASTKSGWRRKRRVILLPAASNIDDSVAA